MLYSVIKNKEGFTEGVESKYTVDFHELKIILFLIIMSNFLPRAGKFIMAFFGPFVGVTGITITFDLSFSGMLSMFAFDISANDYVQFTILFLAAIVTTYTYFKKDKSEE